MKAEIGGSSSSSSSSAEVKLEVKLEPDEGVDAAEEDSDDDIWAIKCSDFGFDDEYEAPYYRDPDWRNKNKDK